MAVTRTFQERSGQSAAYLRFAGTQNDDLVRSEEPPKSAFGSASRISCRGSDGTQNIAPLPAFRDALEPMC